MAAVYCFQLYSVKAPRYQKVLAHNENVKGEEEDSKANARPT